MANPNPFIHRSKRQRILLIELEFPVWSKAKSWSYAAQLAYEEGLAYHEISYVTIPAYWGVESSSPHSWLRHTRTLCRERFDQVWLEMVHSPLDFAFLDWVSALAPVRVGFIPESLEYEQDVYTFAPYLRSRREMAEEKLGFLTHVLAADESDAERLNREGKVHARWWPAAVPRRCVTNVFKRSRRPYAVFYGELYGERSRWLEREDLAELLVRPPSPETGTPYPRRFDELHRAIQARLDNGRMVQEYDLNNYMMQLRRIRQNCFDLWLRGLTAGSAIVNLPHFIRAYPGRVVEAMAAGVPVVSWEIPNRPQTASLFQHEQDMLLFSRNNPEQLTEHLIRIGRDAELAEYLTTNARQKVLEHHTIEKRTEEILNWIDATAKRRRAPEEEVSEPERASEIESNERSEVIISGEQDDPYENGAMAELPGEEEPFITQQVKIHLSDDMMAPAEPMGKDDPGLSSTLIPDARKAYKQAEAAIAARKYLDAVRENPDDIEAWIAVGKFALEMSDLPTARTAFRKAYSLDPRRADVKHQLSRWNDPVLTQIAPQGHETDMEAYYTRLFGEDPEWSKPQPNEDEAARWSKIVGFLRQITQNTDGARLRILDLGCGRGWMTNLASEYGECEGVEPVASVVDMARRHFPGLRFFAGNARTLLDDNAFRPYDAILCSEVIEHIPDDQKEALIDDILRLLTPEGYLILTTPRREIMEQWRRVSNPAQPVEDWMREKDVRRLMTKKGFQTLGHDRVHQDLRTRTFLLDQSVPASPHVIPLYQVWAFQRQKPETPDEPGGRTSEPLSRIEQPAVRTVERTAAPPSEVRKGPGNDAQKKSDPDASSTGATREFRVIAIISAYNEEDIFHHVLRDLIENGVKVYLIDNNSTDNTVEVARHWLGKGLLHIERFPQDCGYPKRSEREYVWRDILRRKEELSVNLRADWFIHADADEFRESPWPDMNLSSAIHFVDSLGYNAITFQLLNFRPINDDFVAGTDVREHMLHYEPGEPFNAAQIKAWKQSDQPVQLAANGGHAVAFPGRRVFPTPFLLRHYPIRGETHGRRKVFKERIPRFNREERAMQWHVQYDEYSSGKTQFLHEPDRLIRYEPDRVRAALLARVSRDILLMETLHGASEKLSSSTLDGGAVCNWVRSILNEPNPVRLSAVVAANETLDRILHTPLVTGRSPEITIPAEQRRIVHAMALIKKAQATLHGNTLTIKRLEALCEALKARI